MRQLLEAFLEDSKLRKILWILLLGLTVSILLYPASIKPDYPLPVQTIYMFPNFPFFVGLFYFWMFLLLILLFSRKGNLIEKLGLCLTFSLVFVNFWTLNNPLAGSGDQLLHLGELRYLREVGSITPEAHQIFEYFDFPGLQFMMLPLTEVMGLNDFQTQIIFLIALTLIFSIIIFVTFLKFLKNPSHTSLGVILAISSSIHLGKMGMLHPANLATLFITVFVLLLAGGKGGLFENTQNKLLFILLAGSAVIEYLFTPFFFFFVLLSVFVSYTLFKEREFCISMGMVIIPFILVLAWIIYQGVYFFKNFVSYLPIAIERLMEGEFLALYQTLGANFGPRYPLWGNITRLFWWGFVFGFGTLLMLAKLFSFHKQSEHNKLLLAGIVGSIVTIVIGSLGTKGIVHGGLSRYIWIAPFFIVPYLIQFLSHHRMKTFGFSFLFITLLVFSLPTFLTNWDNFCYARGYPEEDSAAQFIERIYNKGEGLSVYGYSSGLPFTFYYSPKAMPHYGPEAYGLSEEEIWQSLENTLISFHNSRRTLFVFSEKNKFPYWEYQGISPDHPRWNNIELQLYQANQIYTNKFVEIFIPRVTNL